MKLKKYAIRGLIIFAVVVALCMFFSGTIRTITTAKTIRPRMAYFFSFMRPSPYLSSVSCMPESISFWK